MRHGFPAQKLVVIPNGIDTESFQRRPELGRQLREQWGLKDNDKLIGLVGRLDPMKDHPVFLEAATMLARERNDVRFVCIGDGPTHYQQELFRLSKDLNLNDILIWAGARDDMPAVYSALNIAVSTSAYGEGFPNVVGEAMACGVPCVVTNVGDSALIVGKLGEIAPAKDSEALKQAIERLIARTSRLEGNRQRITKHFSVDQLLANTERTLMRLAQGVKA